MRLEMARCGNKSGSEKPDYDKYFGLQKCWRCGKWEDGSCWWGDRGGWGCAVLVNIVTVISNTSPFQLFWHVGPALVALMYVWLCWKHFHITHHDRDSSSFRSTQRAVKDPTLQAGRWPRRPPALPRKQVPLQRTSTPSFFIILHVLSPVKCGTERKKTTVGEESSLRESGGCNLMMREKMFTPFNWNVLSLHFIIKDEISRLK